MSNRRGKNSKKQKDDSQSSEEKLVLDPYEIIAAPVCVCSPEDHVRKKNCAKNPWCLFGLGEKEGIWRSSNIAINSLGLDPNVYLRKRDPKQLNDEVLYPPAGLRNLGATCYLNVLIQSLFHNLLVQDAVFNMEVDKVKNGNGAGSGDLGGSNEMVPVILALQNSFAHMKLCHDGVVDLTQFVELLGLNKSTQQDPQEFNKLFLAKIESANLTTTHPSRATFNELLSGRVKYVTRCRGCGTERAPPEHPFHELDLSVEGVKSVEEALLAYQAVEVMSGENQYACGVCNGRRDAERCTVILKAPSVLNLHLLRYGYDRETYERKKLTSEVTFSDTIEVCGESFKLVSVLYHKGRSAYGGHYVCDALDWHSGEWWHYDDDTVFATTHPAMNPTNTSTNSNTSNSKSSNSRGSSATVVDLIDTPTSTPSKSPRSNTNTNTSTTTSSAKRIPKKSIVYNEALHDRDSSDGSEEDEEEFEEVPKGKNKRSATGSSGIGKGKGPSTKKGPPSKKQRGAAGGAVEVQDLTAADGNNNNNNNSNSNNSDTEQAAAGAKQTAKLGFNRKRDAYMLTYVRIVDYKHTMSTTRIQPSTTLRSVVGSASSAYDTKVSTYNTNKEALVLEIAQRKEVYDTMRDSMVASSFDNSGGTVISDEFTLVPTWWLHKYIKGDVSTLQNSGSVSTNESSSDSNGGSGCCSGDVVILDNSDTERENVTTSNTIANAASGTTSTNNANNSSSNANNSNSSTQDESQGFEIVDTNTTNTTTNTTNTTANAKCNVINTTSDLCRHGTGLDTAHLERFKVISNTAYSTIFKHAWQHMNHVFDSTNYRCSECFDSVVNQRRTVQSLYTQYDTLLTQINDTNANTYTSNDSGTDSEMYWLSKIWLTQLRKYHTSLHKAEPGKGKPATYAKIFSVSNSALHSEHTTSTSTNTNTDSTDDVPAQTLDPTVNGNILCQHHNPSLNYSKRAVKISSVAWCTLNTLYPDALPIIEGTVACGICANEASNTMENNRVTKMNRLREIDIPALNTLYKAKRIYPASIDEAFAIDTDTTADNANSITNYTTNTDTHTDTNTTHHTKGSTKGNTTQYAVIDGMWLAHWRKYIQDSLFPAPPALTNTALMCRCKGGINSTSDSCGSSGNSGKSGSGRARHTNNSGTGDTSTSTSTTTPSTHHALLPPYLAGIQHSIPPTLHDVHDLVVYKFTESDIGVGTVDPDCMIIDTTSNTNTSTNTTYPKAEIITVEQWNALLVFHHPDKPAPEPEVIDLESENFDTPVSSASTSSDNVYTLLLQYHHTQHSWQYLPALCAVCESTLQASADYSATVYTNGTINVTYFRDELEFRALFPVLNTTTTTTDPTTSTSATNNTSSTTDLASTNIIDEPRRSKRSRGSKSNSTICADSTDTLAIVRLKVYQAFEKLDLPPGSQVLFDSRGACMNSNSKTLAEYGVKKGDKIYVLEGSNPTDSADWECIDFFHTQGGASGGGSGGSGREVEKGFGGTLLQSGPGSSSSSSSSGAGSGGNGGGSGGSGASNGAGSSEQDAEIAALISASALPTALPTTTLPNTTTPHTTTTTSTLHNTFVPIVAPRSPLPKEVQRSTTQEVFEIVDSPEVVSTKHNTCTTHATRTNTNTSSVHIVDSTTTTHRTRTRSTTPTNTLLNTILPNTLPTNTAHANTTHTSTSATRSKRTTRASVSSVDEEDAELQLALKNSMEDQTRSGSLGYSYGGVGSSGSSSGVGSGGMDMVGNIGNYVLDDTLYGDLIRADSSVSTTNKSSSAANSGNAVANTTNTSNITDTASMVSYGFVTSSAVSSSVVNGSFSIEVVNSTEGVEVVNEVVNEVEVEVEAVELTQCSEDSTQSQTAPQHHSSSTGSIGNSGSSGSCGNSGSSGSSGTRGVDTRSQVYEPLLVDEPFLAPLSTSSHTSHTPAPAHTRAHHPAEVVSEVVSLEAADEVEVVEQDTQASALYHTPPSPPATVRNTTTTATTTLNTSTYSTTNTTTNTASHKRKHDTTYELEDGETVSSGTSSAMGSYGDSSGIGGSGGGGGGGGSGKRASTGDGCATVSSTGATGTGSSVGSSVGTNSTSGSRVSGVVRNASRTTTTTSASPTTTNTNTTTTNTTNATHAEPPVVPAVVPAPAHTVSKTLVVPVAPPVVPVAPKVPVVPPAVPVPAVAAPVTSPSASGRAPMIAIGASDLLALLGRKAIVSSAAGSVSSAVIGVASVVGSVSAGGSASGADDCSVGT